MASVAICIHNFSLSPSSIKLPLLDIDRNQAENVFMCEGKYLLETLHLPVYVI